MRELAVLTFQTLDGVMQAPSMPEEDTSGGFLQGGWAAKYWEEVMDQVQRESMAKPYDMLFGRKTYELFAGHWPEQHDENPVSKMMNNARKYVVTSTLTNLEWANSVPVVGDVAMEIAKLKCQDGPLIQVHGSSDLIQTLLLNELIDELRLWTFPVIVGNGKRLFGDGTLPTHFDLVKSEVSLNGVVMGIYRRTRKATND